MKYIKLFIASSIVEFAQERMELSDFIRTLNDIYIPRKIYFQLFLCEDLSNAIAKERKQEEYNQQIRDSQYFYIIFGKGSDRAGDAVYTIEEFDVALAQFRKSGAPKIYTYFRQLPEGESAGKNILDFMHRLDQEIGHYYSTFGCVDAIKLNMLLELTRDPAVGGTVKIEDGMASLDNRELLSVENIPLYSKNETVQQLWQEKKQLEAEMSTLALEHANTPDGDAMQRLLKNSEKRNQITQQLHDLEMDVLNLFRQTSEKRQLGKSLNWRERDALSMIDAGNYAAAKILLEDPEWKAEVQQAEEIAEAAKERILEYISGQKTLIDTYTAEGNTAEIAKKIIAVYADITVLAEKHRIELDVLYDYAKFIYDQRQYPDALAVAKRLEHWYALESETPKAQWAKLQNFLGNIYAEQNAFDVAEELYRKALRIRRDLARENHGAHLPDVAMSCNNLAVLLSDTGRLQEAETLYREALRIYKDLAKENPGVYLPDVAMSYNNLATLLSDTGRLQEAETLYREALRIYKDLAKENPGVYLPDVAMSYNNLATLLSDTGRLQEAETLYREALRIYRDLAKENPIAYLPDVAMSCNYLAILLQKTGELQESENLHREALRIYGNLAKENLVTYLPDVAMSCNYLAILLWKTGEPQESENLHREALRIYRDLAKESPDAYLPDVAMSCNNLAVLLSNSDRLQEAETLYREALRTYKDLAKENPDAYLPDVARSSHNLANLLRNTRRLLEAEKLCREALRIRRALAEKNPNVYLANVANSCNLLASILRRTGRVEEADKLDQEAAEIRDKLNRDT